MFQMQNKNKGNDFNFGIDKHYLKKLKRLKNRRKLKKLYFNLGKYFLGCVIISFLSAVFILNLQSKEMIANAGQYGNNFNVSVLPEIKFLENKQIEGNSSSVLGVSEALNKNTDNPFTQYEFTSKLYLENPKLVLNLESKIAKYMTKYRSYEGLDNKYDIPVSPIIFLETSLKYQVPLSYTLSVARLESRFGTDCFSENNLTRICKHKNIFSLGLDDSGNNWTFNNWDDGVYAFGQWYQKKVEQGLSTCQIWRMYNPNGNYCLKVLDTSMELEAFFRE